MGGTVCLVLGPVAGPGPEGPVVAIASPVAGLIPTIPMFDGPSWAPVCLNPSIPSLLLPPSPCGPVGSQYCDILSVSVSVVCIRLIVGSCPPNMLSGLI